MPAISKDLEFPCPKCRREDGSIEVIKVNPKPSSDIRIVKDFRGNETNRLQTQRRPDSKPVENAWKNRVESIARYDKIKNTLTRLTDSYLSFIRSNSDGNQRQVLRGEFCKIVNKFAAALEEEKRAFEQEDLQDAVWDVCDEEGNTKWNPVRIIKIYRKTGDPFVTINLPYEFFYKVIKKHNYAITEYLTKEEWNSMCDGHDVYAKYSVPFYNKNWRYTWFELFVIARYAAEKGPRRAERMLRALDKGEKSLSSEYIRDRIYSILEFEEKFKNSISGFFRLIFYLQGIIENDPELKEEYETILRDREIGRKDYEDQIRRKYYDNANKLSNQLHSLTQHEDNDNRNVITQDETLKEDNQNDDDIVVLHNGIILIGNERIKIHHPNKDYNNEKSEYEKHLRMAKPKRRITCGPFHPSRLPVYVLEQLCNEGKIQT